MSCNGQQWIERPSDQSSICRDFPYRVETEAIVEELNVLVDRIKRLEEYIHNLQKLGDSMALGRNLFIQNAWTAAKEAKP
jgi:hypothetical protein